MTHTADEVKAQIELYVVFFKLFGILIVPVVMFVGFLLISLCLDKVVE